jgi:6-phosphogluconolactonase
VLRDPGELLVQANAEQLAASAAELFVSLAEDSARAQRRFRVALSGGSTPHRVYELLATAPFSDRVDWNGVDFFWGDERYVPAEDRDSNYHMTNEALLRHIPVPADNVHRVPTEIGPPESVAAAYELQIRQTFGESVVMPQFDLIFLGLGTNGHTASLFPRSPALRERKKLVVADFVSEVNNWRLSMTVPLLNRGRTVAFVVSGAEKAKVLRDVLLGLQDPERLPAQLIAPEGKLLWLVDQDAASLLPQTTERKRA